MLWMQERERFHHLQGIQVEAQGWQLNFWGGQSTQVWQAAKGKTSVFVRIECYPQQMDISW